MLYSVFEPYLGGIEITTGDAPFYCVVAAFVPYLGGIETNK